MLHKAFLACILSEEVVCLIWFLFWGYMEPTQTEAWFLRERTEVKLSHPGMRTALTSGSVTKDSLSAPCGARLPPISHFPCVPSSPLPCQSDSSGPSNPSSTKPKNVPQNENLLECPLSPVTPDAMIIQPCTQLQHLIHTTFIGHGVNSL